MAVAVNVFSGTADVGLGIMAAARALGLDFIPLLPERYDLVVPETTFAEPVGSDLAGVIRSGVSGGRVGLGGYDLRIGRDLGNCLGANMLIVRGAVPAVLIQRDVVIV